MLFARPWGHRSHVNVRTKFRPSVAYQMLAVDKDPEPILKMRVQVECRNPGPISEEAVLGG